MKVWVLLSAMVALMPNGLCADDMKSGPQIGEKVRPFQPLHITGIDKGKKRCLVCKSANNPSVMIFARQIDPAITNLIHKVESVAYDSEDNVFTCFVVFCSDDPEMEVKLKEYSRKENFKRTTIALDSGAGPDDYKIPANAGLTVVMYVKKEVKANFAFEAAALKNLDIDMISAEISRVLLTARK